MARKKLRGLLLVAGMAVSAGSPASVCPQNEITRCISALTGTNAPTIDNNPPGPEDIIWLADADSVREYHKAMIQVLPDSINRQRQMLIEMAATSNSRRQLQIFIYLALYEFFSGYPDQAVTSLRHARALAPEESRLVMLEHFFKTSGPLMETAIQQAGFSPPLCRQTEPAATESLRMLTGEPLESLNRQIESLPDIQWRLVAWFLMARYMNALNPCLLQADFYDYQVLRTLKSLQTSEQTHAYAGGMLEIYDAYSEGNNTGNKVSNKD